MQVAIGGENLYTDVHIDYRLSDITANDIKPILLGERSERLPEVISSTANDNIFVFWSSHGYQDKLCWGEQMHCGTVANPIRVMLREHSDEGTRYKYIRNLMNGFVAPDDTCVSYRLMLQDLEAFMDALFEHIHIENNILFPRFVKLEAQCVAK